jgi:hypothetical protein
MKKSSVIFVLASLCSPLLATAAEAQNPPGQGGGGQPDKPTGGFSTSPTQRTYWPTTDFYDPAKMIGRYAYITKDGRMDFATTRVSSVKGPVTTKFQNAAPALTYDFKKKDDINIGVPGIASANYSDEEFMHLELNDISESDIDGTGADFCTDWPRFKYIRSWEVGDKIVFIDHVLTSRAAYKTGKMQAADAKIGIGSYFSAGGGTALSTSTETNVPAMAVNGVTVTLTIPLIANGCPRPPSSTARYAHKIKTNPKLGDQELGVIRTMPVSQKSKIAPL